MEKFVLIAEPRSGTTFFNSVVRTHPDVHVFGEILPGYTKPENFHHFWLERIEDDPGNILLNRYPELFSEYLDFLPTLCPEAQCLGVDIKYYQLEWKFDTMEVLRQHDYKVVHLIRRNSLKRHVSLALHKPDVREALGRGMHDSKDRRFFKIAIEAGDQLLALMAGYRDRIKLYSETLQRHFPYMELVFEDVLDKERNSLTTGSLDRLYDFLNLDEPGDDLDSPMRKLNPSLLRHSVLNYHEVVETLAGTEFRWMLDDPEKDPERIAAFAALTEGEMALGAGRADRAGRALAGAARLAPDLPDPVYLLGMLAVGAGDPAGGMEILRRAMAMTQGTPGHAYFDNLLRTTPMDARSRNIVDLVLHENETTQ